MKKIILIWDNLKIITRTRIFIIFNDTYIKLNLAPWLKCPKLIAVQECHLNWQSN